MRVGTEPHKLNILEEGDFRRRPKIVPFIWRNRKFADGVSPHKRRTLTIFPILGDESLRRWYLRHREANSGPIDERHTVRRVMQAHHDIRSSRHEKSGVHRAIVFVRQPRQIAKLVATTYSLDALTARFLGAAHFPPDDDPFLRVHAPTAILADSVIISRHFHPLIHVVFCRGFMLLEIKAKVMHHRWLARQNLDGRDPGILLERSRNRQLLPFLDAAGGDRIER